MLKKIVFVIVILLILIVGIFTFKTVQNKKESNTSNTQSEQNMQNEQAIQNNETTQNTNTEVNEQENNISTENENVTIKQEVSPKGFMGSSLYKVVLYSNKEVYIQTYDGNGYEEKNMASKMLIAKDVDSISVSQDETNFGEVIIKGGTPVNQDMGWIIFE